MEFEIVKQATEEKGVLVLGLFEENTDLYKSSSETLAQEIQEAIDAGRMSKKFGNLYSTKIDNERFLIVGLGKQAEITTEKVRRAIAKAVKYAKGSKYSSLTTNIADLVRERLDTELLGRAVAEGAVLSSYQFKKYQAKPEEDKDVDVSSLRVIFTGEEAAFSQGLYVGKAIAESNNYIRDLINEPAVVCTPLHLLHKSRIAKFW